MGVACKGVERVSLLDAQIQALTQENCLVFVRQVVLKRSKSLAKNEVKQSPECHTVVFLFLHVIAA